MAKAGIHPTYYPKASVTCSCGAKFEIGSTKDSLRVDICRECHPFYSGNQKLIDTAGRVDRFRERMATATAMQAAKPAKKSRNKDQHSEGESSDMLDTSGASFHSGISNNTPPLKAGHGGNEEVTEEATETPAPAVKEVKTEVVEEPTNDEVEVKTEESSSDEASEDKEEVETEVAPVAEESTDGENA